MPIFIENNDLNDKANPVLGLSILTIAIFVVNYISIKVGSASGSLPLVTFIAFLVVLFLLNPVYVFVYCFVLHVNVISCFSYDWAKFLTFAGMYAVFVKDIKLIRLLLEDKKLKKLALLSLLFGLYVLIINIAFKSELNVKTALSNFAFMFGFLSIIPAYYCTVYYPKRLLMSLVVVAACFVFVYFISIIKNLDLFRLENYDRDTGASIERLAGYDLRQFIIFFVYLIPGVVLSVRLKNRDKFILLGVGLCAYVILILAFYRLAMFYVVIGALLSFLFIKKYVEARTLFKFIFIFIVLFLAASMFFGEYLTEIQKLFSNTIDYFTGNATDSSADTRFDTQFPIMTKLFFANLWTGMGLAEIKAMQEFGMMGFVDMPLMGTLTAFGIIGMLIYYLKFFVLLAGTQTNLYYINESEFDPFIFFIYSTLKAYFITMITFRFFYISWELTFDYQQTEFGLFSGVFLALHQHIKNAENACEEDGETAKADSGSKNIFAF